MDILDKRSRFMANYGTGASTAGPTPALEFAMAEFHVSFCIPCIHCPSISPKARMVKPQGALETALPAVASFSEDKAECQQDDSDVVLGRLWQALQYHPGNLFFHSKPHHSLWTLCARSRDVLMLMLGRAAAIG
jgi:hypothetical protein